MSKYHVEPPQFQWSFLLPKYWLTWLSIGFLYLISWLPYRLQLGLGTVVGIVLHKLMKKRARITQRNLELAYPDMSSAERQRITREVFKNSGIALFETGIAWWWPDWRLKRKVKLEGFDLVEAHLNQGKGVFLLLFHFLALEVHARGVGIFHPSVGLYRPHNNALMEYLQTKGRSRSNKYMLGKKDVKGMLWSLQQGELCGYLPDQDYGPRRAVFVPLFNVPDAATTTGTSIFANHPNAVTLISTIERLPNAQGYCIRFKAPHSAIPTGDDKEDAIRVNQEVEAAVQQQPEMYMWMHRRFKTRPQPDLPSYYDASHVKAKKRRD